MGVSVSRSSQERSEAFALAAHLRSVHVDTVDRLRRNELGIEDVLRSDDPFISRLKVVVILENLPGLSKVLARKIMEDIGLSGYCKVRDLDSRQQAALVDRLDQ